jgi:hypothetical protein
METNPTPFDLNHAIQTWRENLNHSPAFGRENLDELETHLRDSVAALQARGLSEAEAFIIAVRRAGSSVALGLEFGKVNPRGVWLDRVLWMLVGNLVFWIVSDLLSPIGSGLLFFGFRQFGGTEAHSSNYLCIAFFSTLIRMLTFAGVLAVCWRFFTRDWGRVTPWLARNSRSSTRLAAMTVMGILILMLTRLIPGFTSMLMVKFTNPAAFGRFATGQSLGGMIASFVESSVFILLTLWLARRRLPAKT